jgi:hypothetical protein
MTFAQRGSAYSASIPETVIGTTPATPTLTYLGATDNTMTFGQGSAEDDRVHVDGQSRYVAFLNQTLTGDISGPVVFGMWDHFFESALQTTEATKTFKFNTIVKTLTVERGYTNLSPNQFHVFRGVQVDKMEITAGITGTPTVKFSCVARSFAEGTTTISTSAVTDTSSLVPAKTQGGSFKIGGALNSYVQSVTLATDRGLAAQYGFGNAAPLDYASTNVKVSGTVVVLFTDDVMLAKYRNGTADSLEFMITDGTNTYTFHLGSVYYTAAPTSLGTNAAIPITLSFTAVYNASDASGLVITTS